MTKNQAYIYESIVSQVRMGFHSGEEIKETTIEEVEGNGFDDEISEKWVNSEVDAEFKKLKAESEKWEHPTYTERLAKAFNELCKMKIIALHNAGYTTSDGEGEVVEVEVELNEKGIESEGYCFYHEQDLMRAIEGDSLLIAYQKVDNEDKKVTIHVGNIVVEKLREQGFEVVWDGSGETIIEIPKFQWRKIYADKDEGLYGNRRVYQLMKR